MDPLTEEADLGLLLAQVLSVLTPARELPATREPPPAADAAHSAPADKEDTPAIAGSLPAPPGSQPPALTGSQFPALTGSEARALIELLAAKGIAQGQLAAALGLEKSTVSRLAASLERKGLIRRGRDARDQRYLRLYLTPEGAALAGRAWRAWQSRQARVLAALSPGERASLAAGLRGLVRNLAAEGLLAASPADAPAGGTEP